MKFVPPYKIAEAGRFAAHLHPDHRVDLINSGLNDDILIAARVHSLSPRYLDRFFQNGAPTEISSALCFPYPPRQDFARIKLFPSLGKMKYTQLSGTTARLYMPFPVRDGELIIAEGEKKTLAAHQAGLNAIGIGGVWNWLSKGKPIGDFEGIDLEGRQVTIIPDSDIFERLDLLRAIYALGRDLQSRGSLVEIAQIPQLTNKKTGLDDFTAAGGDVHDLETFTLSSHIFSPAAGWHRKWKIKKALLFE